MTDTDTDTPSTLTDEEIAEKAADLEATYTLLCEFCVQMEFRPSSLTGAMAIMLFEMAAARGVEAGEGLREVAAIWDRVRDAERIWGMAGEAVH
jgi:hypothetical protein